MICCATAALFVAVAAMWQSAVKSAWLLKARWMVAAIAVSLALAGGSALAAHDRAANDDLAAMLMRHICGQQPVSQPSVD